MPSTCYFNTSVATSAHGAFRNSPVTVMNLWTLCQQTPDKRVTRVPTPLLRGRIKQAQHALSKKPQPIDHPHVPCGLCTRSGRDAEGPGFPQDVSHSARRAKRDVREDHVRREPRAFRVSVRPERATSARRRSLRRPPDPPVASPQPAAPGRRAAPHRA